MVVVLFSRMIFSLAKKKNPLKTKAERILVNSCCPLVALSKNLKEKFSWRRTWELLDPTSLYRWGGKTQKGKWLVWGFIATHLDSVTAISVPDVLHYRASLTWGSHHKSSFSSFLRFFFPVLLLWKDLISDLWLHVDSLRYWGAQILRAYH